MNYTEAATRAAAARRAADRQATDLYGNDARYGHAYRAAVQDYAVWAERAYRAAYAANETALAAYRAALASGDPAAVTAANRARKGAHKPYDEASAVYVHARGLARIYRAWELA